MLGNLADLTAELRTRLADLGFELVDIRQGGSRSRPRLQIRIDRLGGEPGHGVTVDDCGAVSRALEPWLEGTGALGPSYELEVSSPGVERPVRWLEHWARFVGREVNVRLRGRGRVRAAIVGVVQWPEQVVLRVAGSEDPVTVPVTEARDATLAVDWDAGLRKR